MDDDDGDYGDDDVGDGGDGDDDNAGRLRVRVKRDKASCVPVYGMCCAYVVLYWYMNT